MGAPGLEAARHQAHGEARRRTVDRRVARAGLPAPLDYGHLQAVEPGNGREAPPPGPRPPGAHRGRSPGNAARPSGPTTGRRAPHGQRAFELLQATLTCPCPAAGRYRGGHPLGPPPQYRERDGPVAVPGSPRDYRPPGGPRGRRVCPRPPGLCRRRRRRLPAWARRRSPLAPAEAPRGVSSVPASTSSSSPGRRRRPPVPNEAPPTLTRPSATRREAWARLTPARSASALSTRSPAKAAGTVSRTGWLGPPGFTRPVLTASGRSAS